MKHYKEVQVPATAETRRVNTTCDICGELITTDTFKVDRVTVEHKTVNAYPGGGSGETKSCDICSECFESKVIPALENLGVNFVTEEWEF